MSSSESSSNAENSSSSNGMHESFAVSDIENRRPKKSRIVDRSDASYADSFVGEPSTSTIRCFMCSFAHTDIRTVEEHMNTIHLDLTSTSDESTGHQEPVFNCPMCPYLFSDASSLQIHVNSSHKDILSPMKVEPDRGKPELVNKCPVCNISSKSAEDLIAHVDEHFSNRDQFDSALYTTCDRLFAEQLSKTIEEKEKLEQEKEFERLKEQYGMNDRGDFKQQSTINMQKAVSAGRLTLSDYFEKQSKMKSAEYRGVDDGSSCVRNVIPRIRDKSRSSINVGESYVCYNTDFYGSSFGDRGWGCGYRNIQMLLSALSRNQIYAELIQKHILLPNFNIQKTAGNSMPSISKIQEMIEWAWEEGFDAQGRVQLDGKLCGTRKWIGATEVVTLLSSMRIKCELVDIIRPTVAKLHYRMFDWIIEYFKKKDSFKPPLYLQHEGHSRTIIGVEILKDGEVLLLILDPAIDSYKIDNMLTSSNPCSTLKLLRKSLSSMTSKQYQIVSVRGVLNSEEEYLASQILRSNKIQ